MKIGNNNYLSVINKMTISQRKDGRYEGRITINGKRKGFYGSTKTEVKNKAKEYLLEIVANDFVPSNKITLNDYAIHWLEHYKKNKIQPSSYSRLCTTFYKQIMPTIGKMKVYDITTKNIQKLIDDFANPKDHKNALALSGLKKVVNFLHPCLERAVDEKIIAKNPCVNIMYPQQDCIQKQTKVQTAMSDKELQLFKNTALSKYKNGRQKSRDWLILLLILNTGVRVGEMIALKWTDIDLVNNTMRINKTLQNYKEYESATEITYYSRIRESTKTSNGVRYIPLNDQCKEYIKSLKQYDNEEHIVSDYIACTRKGTRSTSRNLQRSLDRLTKEAKITTHISLHTLRHSFGSTLLRRHVDIAVISKLMGHANITITYNKYIHVIQEEQAKAMQMVNIC